MEEFTPSESSREEKRDLSDAYFDILSHDVTNLISPMMVHAEFISVKGELPRDVRESAAKIVKLIRRTANFILSFRMLHEIAQDPPMDPEEFDLRSLAQHMQETASSEYPFNRPFISLVALPDGLVEVVGAEYVRMIVVGLVDNAIRNAPRAEVFVNIALSEFNREDGQPMWRFEVIDDGPGIPGATKTEIVQPFEASRRLTRKSPSSLMFYSAIIGHMDGRLAIEDRVPGDVSKGTRVVMELPRAKPASACDG